LFILSIGLSSENSGILDFLSGSASFETIIAATIAIFGLLVILALNHYKVKGTVFFGILASTIGYVIIQFAIGNNPFDVLVGASFLPDFSSFINYSFLNFDFAGTFIGDGSFIMATITHAIIIIFSYVLINLFDTVGTLYGATKGTSLQNEKGEIVNFERALWMDGYSTIVSAGLGVVACTTYVESAAGIKSGARTGLATLVTTMLFMLALFMAPIFSLIPPSAIAPALIFIGFKMAQNILDINFKDFSETVVAITVIILMPLTKNIAFGIGAGIILYCFMKLIAKEGKKVNWLTYVLAAMFILLFITQNINF